MNFPARVNTAFTSPNSIKLGCGEMKVSGVRPVNPPDNLQLLPDDEPAEVLDVVGAAVAGVPSRALLVTHLYSRYIVQQSDVLTIICTMHTSSSEIVCMLCNRFISKRLLSKFAD